jgi:hypothetical protein
MRGLPSEVESFQVESLEISVYRLLTRIQCNGNVLTQEDMIGSTEMSEVLEQALGVTLTRLRLLFPTRLLTAQIMIKRFVIVPSSSLSLSARYVISTCVLFLLNFRHR